MAYSDAKAAIGVHAAAAGAALPVVMPSAVAFPMPVGRCIRVYYGGETDPAHMGPDNQTLNSELVGKVTIIAAFWPLADMSETMAAAIDADMETLGHEIRTRLNGDATLGTTTTDLLLEWATPDIQNVFGGWYAVLLWRVITDFVEYARAP